MIPTVLETDHDHCLQAYRCRVPAKLGWWDGSGLAPGCIKKLSRRGATIETEEKPPDFAALWVRLEGAPGSEWVEARIVAVEPASGHFPWFAKTGYEIQVMFVGQHPDELFAFVFGDLTHPLADDPAGAGAEEACLS